MSADGVGAPLRILIVEDDPTFSSVLQMLFSEHWHVHCVPDGESALAVIEDVRPHLVLVDYRLPGIDGIELAHRLAEIPETRSVPVVMLSGVAGPTERERALDTGILDVLVKPVSERELKRRAQAIASIGAAHRAALEAAQARQQDAEDRLRLVLENVRDYAILMLDARGHVLEWNRGAGMLQGWSEAEVLGRHVSEFFPENERSRASALLGEAAVTHSARDVGWQVRADGSQFWADTVATALYATGGGLRGYAFIARDLSDQRRQEQDRERLLEEARAANESKERFLAVLSHELRTPLNAILGWVHLLRGGSLDPEKAARAAEVIERNAQNQAKLVEQILDLSRLVTGRFQLTVEPMDVTTAVAAALDTVRPLLAEKQLAVDTELAETPLVLGDAARLQQVVAQVIRNAVQFSPPAGRIALRTSAETGRVRVSVQDRGPGIPEEFQSRLFVPFEQADASPSRQHGGMGLGLSICKLVVERHHGTILVNTSPAGTEVTIELPALSHTTRETAGNAVAGGTFAGLRVLVVDDHADTAEFVSLMLRSLGATVLVANDADTALAALRQHRPDVLLSDIEMPGKTGLDLIRAVRALPAEEGGRTPAGAFTAYARAEDRDGARAAGFDAHLAKPVKPDELMRTVLLLGQQVSVEARAAATGPGAPLASEGAEAGTTC